MDAHREAWTSTTPARLAGRYWLGEPLGRGRSAVFRAIDIRLDRRVAVKQVELLAGQGPCYRRAATTQGPTVGRPRLRVMPPLRLFAPLGRGHEVAGDEDVVADDVQRPVDQLQPVGHGCDA